MIIYEQEINKMIDEAASATQKEFDEIIAKAREGNGLSLFETAVLLNQEEKSNIELIYSVAKELKEKIYGRRIVLFAPLYLTNKCVNNCLYCGFRVENKALSRRTLSLEEIADEVKSLEDQGHKRLLLVAGEHPVDSKIDYLVEAIERIYEKSDIRRLNINAAPMEHEDFVKLKNAGIGTYQCFQETYHKETYKKMHPSGKKSDYDYRITVMDRAMEAGVDDVGMGVLFGLYDYKFDALALLQHAQYLENKYNCGPHTISVPRLRPAPGAHIEEVQYPISDEEFKKLVAVIRISVPYTGLILSTRESQKLREELLDLGISQLSAGSSTSPGGYRELKNTVADQFYTNDNRSLDQVSASIIDLGYVPSFCTACYRVGRTGEHFMRLVKEGKMKNICRYNALLTLKEYGETFASDATKGAAEDLIAGLIDEIDDPRLKEQVKAKLKRIENGERDLFI